MKKIIKILFERSKKHSWYLNDLTVTLFGRYMIMLMWNTDVIRVMTKPKYSYFFEVIDCKDGKCNTVIKLPKS